MFQKKMYQTNYGQVFGRMVIDQGDVTVLKFKKLAELACAKPLKEMVRVYLDSWISKGEHKHYVSKVLHLLRNLLTFIQTQKPTRATSKDIHKRFKPYDITPTDRFDKIFNFSSTARGMKRS